MTHAWPPVISQVHYPGAGDVDDCWCVATVWAATASKPDIHYPTVPEFRKAAGDPDDGHFDGGTLDEVIRGSRGVWDDLPVLRVQTTSWAEFANLVKDGRPASLAVDSGDLPPEHRYGFHGKHQVGVAWSEPRRAFVLANPLARTGSAPKPITEAALRKAAMALIPQLQEVRAAVYPVPVHEEKEVGLALNHLANAAGTVAVRGEGHDIIAISDSRRVSVPAGQRRHVVAKVRALEPIDANPGDRRTGWVIAGLVDGADDYELAFLLASDADADDAVLLEAKEA